MNEGKLEFLIGLDKRIIGLLEVASRVRHNLKPEEIWSFAIKIIKDRFTCQACSVMLIEERTRTLEIKIFRGLSGSFVKKFKPKVDEGIIGEIIKAGHPILLNERDPHSKYYHLRFEADWRSILCLPLWLNDKVVGLAHMESAEPNDFSEVDLGIFQAIVNYALVAAEQARLQDKVKEMTVIDEATKCYTNRYFQRHLLEEVERAKRFKHPFSVILIGIDHIEQYKSMFGRLRSGENILEIAEIIRKNIREVDLAAVRYGGREFIVLLPETETTTALEIAEGIRMGVEERFKEEKELPITVSIGLITFLSGSVDGSTICSKAEHALLQSQRHGGNRITALSL